jgi:TolB-like protein
MYQHQHIAPPFEKLRNISEPMIALLDVLLAKDPSRRFQTPAQLQQALRQVKGAIGSGLRLTANELRPAGDEVAEDLSKRKPRKQTVRGALVIGLCLATGLIAWLSFFGHPGFLSNQRVNEAVPTEKSVAVLPFESLSESKSDAYFADGVQDEILNNLAKIAQLKVISRTSVMQYRADSKRDLRQIASALGVATVLEGTVRRDGNHVRVSTELVDARNDNTIWADSYDRDLTNIFSIQSEIAQTVASKLSTQFSPQQRREIEEKPTANLEAYDLYLQAKALLGPEVVVLLWSNYKPTFSRAIVLLEEATQKDRKFALAYCLIAKAHDYLYPDEHTPERRALGDTAINEALRLRPDLPEVHLAAALHLFICYRDFERTRVQIAIAAQALPNNPDLLQLTAFVDQVQGRWEKCTAGLERASTLDPRNPEILDSLAYNYLCLRRYRDSERIQDRLIELEPDQPWFPIDKAKSAFLEKADLTRVRAAYEALPPSIKDDLSQTENRVYYAMCARDFDAASEMVTKSPNEEIFFLGAGTQNSSLVPRQIVTLWLELVRGNQPNIQDFGAAREQLYRKVQADRTDPFLLTALALADVALGRKEESIKEGRRAMQMRSISDDAVDGAVIAANIAIVYAWANQSDLAFEQLDILIKMPAFLLSYGNLKTNPSWNPLRKDPRFDKLLAELAPHD